MPLPPPHSITILASLVFGIVIGITASFTIIKDDLIKDLATLLGAAGGAFITIAGLAWIEDRKERQRREALMKRVRLPLMSLWKRFSDSVNETSDPATVDTAYAFEKWKTVKVLVEEFREADVLRFRITEGFLACESLLSNDGKNDELWGALRTLQHDLSSLCELFTVDQLKIDAD